MMQTTDNPLKRRVHLYYLGGLTENGKVAHVLSRGKPFQVPEVGGSLEMELYYANDLILRGHNGVHSVWSLSPRDAAMAKAGTLHRDTSKLVDPNTLTIEQLQALLEKQQPVESEEDFQARIKAMAAVDDPDEDLPIDEDEPLLAPEAVKAEETEAPARKSPGRPRKTPPKEEKEEASE